MHVQVQAAMLVDKPQKRHKDSRLKEHAWKSDTTTT